MFARKKDAFVLCRIFQKSGLGPPNGDRYAPFIEEEWDDDTALMVPGGEAEDDVGNGDEAQVEGHDLDQVHILGDLFNMSKLLHLMQRLPIAALSAATINAERYNLLLQEKSMNPDKYNFSTFCCRY